MRKNQQMRFSSPTCFMAQRKETVDEAFAGDIIGLPDTGNFKIGDTLTAGEELHFKGLPSFSPEMFKYIENADPMKQKQLDKGVNQLMDEGVAQLFVSQMNGRKIIGTVGQLQFEVIQYRLEHEYNAKCRWEPLQMYKACWIESDDEAELEMFKKRKAQYMAFDKDGREEIVAIFQPVQNAGSYGIHILEHTGIFYAVDVARQHGFHLCTLEFCGKGLRFLDALGSHGEVAVALESHFLGVARAACHKQIIGRDAKLPSHILRDEHILVGHNTFNGIHHMLLALQYACRRSVWAWME